MKNKNHHGKIFLMKAKNSKHTGHYGISWMYVMEYCTKCMIRQIIVPSGMRKDILHLLHA